MEDTIFKADAKQIVDLAFDNHLFRDDVTRDDMNGFEELIHFLLKSKYESYERATKLFERIEAKKELNNKA